VSRATSGAGGGSDGGGCISVCENALPGLYILSFEKGGRVAWRETCCVFGTAWRATWRGGCCLFGHTTGLAIARTLRPLPLPLFLCFLCRVMVVVSYPLGDVTREP